MPVMLDLDYTPVCPQRGLPFSEPSFERRSVRATFERGELAVLLVDLWNIGFDDGPVDAELGVDGSTEFGLSHALRKRAVIEQVITPTVQALRKARVLIIHGNHAPILQRYPQWAASTTPEEPVRFAAAATAPSAPPTKPSHDAWPPVTWATQWSEGHQRLVYDPAWQRRQGDAIYPKLDIPAPVRPQGGDLLAADDAQIHRLLRERRVRVLFFMGFETAHCVQNSPYGMAAMARRGYGCVLVRDATASPESAETLDGLWRTRAEIIGIEQRYGYSTTTQALVRAVRGDAP